MALSSRFAAPVSDATEDKLWLTRIPKKMQKVTAWGMRVWDDWAAARPVLSDTDHDHARHNTTKVCIKLFNSQACDQF